MSPATQKYPPKLHYDFRKLAKDHPDLLPFFDPPIDPTVDVQHHSRFQFNLESNNLLFKYILYDELNIDVLDISPEHLCPVVPSRIQYLLIVKDVLEECGLIKDKPIRGIDVGTGYYGIYSLLASRLFGWEMVGVDIDPESIENMKRIIEKNDMTSSVKAVHSTFYGEIGSGQFHFAVCNPPFYESEEEMSNAYEMKGLKDEEHEVVVGSSSELIYHGDDSSETGKEASKGELGFIKQMIDESLKKSNQIIWFSTLVNKKSNVSIIIDHFIHNRKVYRTDNFFIKEFQGGRVKRWIVFWSFQNFRCVIENTEFKNVFKTSIEHSFSLNEVQRLLEEFKGFLEIRELKGEDLESIALEITGHEQCWTRSFQRKLKFGKHLELNLKTDEHKFKFIITEQSIRWAFGAKYTDFQSFHAYLLHRIISNRK